MVLDGIYYALALTAGGGVVSYFTRPAWGIPLYLLAAFCLYFFRDPERPIPAGAVAVSPADGKIVAVKKEGPSHTRISIFLNIFDVHVNRAPISGCITDVQYKPGRFLVASREEASSQNEQNEVTIQGDGTRVVFKQIAGLIARRVVFKKKTGDVVQTGERVGLIKFGSRVDVVLGPEWAIQVREGERVMGGSSVLAWRCEFAAPALRAGERMTPEGLEPGWAD
ncbi:MAG TPA: phosphatidylserine decarboxylase [Bryobacteraceae bacterium]|nr:phosphatidylserine decarboxylase [Bryobacteraceae bacterium]